MRKKNKVKDLTLPSIKLYCKAIVIKTAWYWHKNRDIDQWNRTESPEINPCFYGQLIFDKEARRYSGVKTVFSTNDVGKIAQVHAKKKKKEKETRPPTHTYTSTNSKWIKDLTVSHKTIKNPRKRYRQ